METRSNCKPSFLPVETGYSSLRKLHSTLLSNRALEPRGTGRKCTNGNWTNLSDHPSVGLQLHLKAPCSLRHGQTLDQAAQGGGGVPIPTLEVFKKRVDVALRDMV